MPFDATSVSQTTFPVSLLDLHALVETDPILPEVRRVQTRWALAAIEKRTPTLLSRTHASADGIKAVLRHLRAEPKGLSCATITNIGSFLRRALERHGPPPAVAVPSPGPGPAEARLSLVQCRFARMALRPFLHWLDEADIVPAAVDRTSLERYATEAAPRRVQHVPQHVAKVRKAWNDQVGLGTEGWPGTILEALPPRRQRLAAHPVDLHPDVLHTVDAHYAGRVAAKKGPRLAEGYELPPLKASSARKSLANLMLYVGALQELGTDTASIETLAELLHPDRARPALNLIARRSAIETGTGSANVASTISALALHSKALPEPQASTLRAFAKRLRPTYTGMVQDKVNRLLPLRDPALRRKLFELPYEMAREGMRAGGKAGARMVETALAMEVLATSCLRVSNVASLHLVRNFVGSPASSTERSGRRFLVVSSSQVKNEEGQEMELRPETIALMDLFVRHHRPALVRDAGRDDGCLFPGRTRQGGLDVGTLRKRVMRAIRERLGLLVSPHLYRSIAVMAYLERRPGDFATLMKLLGHRRLETLIKHYAFIDRAASAKAVQDLILYGRQVEAPLCPGSRKTWPQACLSQPGVACMETRH